MYCPNCGIPNREDERFCINCKELLQDLEEEEGFLDEGSMINPSLEKIDLFKAFFDISFIQLISPKIIKFLYGLSFLLAGLISFFVIVVGFKISNLIGRISIFIVGPLIFLITIIFSRVFLETILINSKISKEEGSQKEKPKSEDLIQWNI